MALTDKLTAIGNAIRSKTGSSSKMTLDEMPGEILSIEVGGDEPGAVLGSKSIDKNGDYYAINDGYDGYSHVNVSVPTLDTSDANATENDILKGATAYVNGKKVTGKHECEEGVDTSDATAGKEDIAYGETAYVNGVKVTGSVPVVASGEGIGVSHDKTQKDNDNFVVQSKVANDALMRAGCVLQTQIPASTFGEASTDSVLAGQTFTSKDGINLTGTYTPAQVKLQTKRVTPETSVKQVTYDAADGYTGLSQVTVEAIQTQSKEIYRNGTYTPDSGKFFDSVTVNILSDAKLGDPIEYTFGQISITAGSGVSVSYTYAESFHVEDGNVILDNPTTQKVTMQTSDTTGYKFEFLLGNYFQKSGTTYYVPPECNIVRKGETGFSGTVTSYKFVGTIYPVIVDAGVVMGTKTITENGTYYASTDGYDGFESVNVEVSGIDTSDANATAADIVKNKTAYVNGEKITGTMADNGTVNEVLDTSTTSYTIPAGKHSGSGKVSISTETKSVTPKKNSQTVTPSSGKVLGSVTVDAIPSNYIEPSGTLDVSSNGIHNVTSYASVNVNVPASGVELPTLTNLGYASDLLAGKQLIGQNGEIVEGSMADRGSMSRTIDGINTTSVSGSNGYYSGVSVTFDSSAIEALLDAL